MPTSTRVKSDELGGILLRDQMQYAADAAPSHRIVEASFALAFIRCSTRYRASINSC